nr:MAG TPA_asm: hypothetical protein [Bacteriophage sp.]
MYTKNGFSLRHTYRFFRRNRHRSLKKPDGTQARKYAQVFQRYTDLQHSGL